VLRRSSAVFVALVCVLTGVSTAAHARADEVHGDDARDDFVGTGGLILPGSVDDRVRREVASCVGCEFRVTSPCASTDLGAPLDDTCAGAVRGCPVGRLRRTWFRPESGVWRDTGVVCMRSSPWTVAQAADAVADRVAKRVPPGQLSVDPPAGILPHLPTYFSTGTDGPALTLSLTVAGHQVDVDAQALWSWSFGDGGELETRDPGGPYPVGGVRHTYRVAGRYLVECHTTWRAVFWTEGLGPFPVPEPVRQVAHEVVTVGEGRAVLAPAR
jgi:hypothetical protein